MSAKVGAEGADLETIDEVEMSEKYGSPKEFDPKFQGPIEKRGCTDILCLLFLVTFIIGWAVVAVIAFKHGDPSILVHPTDSWGQKCGMDAEVQNKSYLYFFDITKCAEIGVVLSGCRTPQVCVESCPQKFWSYVYGKNILKQSQAEMKANMICKYGVNKAEHSVEDLIAKNYCASYILPSKTKNITKVKLWRRNPVKNVKSIFATRCIPKLFNDEEIKEISKYSDKGTTINETTITKGVKNLLDFINAKENVEYLFEDFRSTWLVIIILLMIGALSSLIWICLMRCFAGVMVWASLFGTIGVLSYGCYFSVSKYLDLKSAEDMSEMKTEKAERFIDIEFRSQLDTYLKLKDTWLAFAIITGTLLGILLFVVLVLRSRLGIAVALIKQGARAVSDMTFTLGWPLVPWIVQLFVIAIFLAIGIHLISATEEVWQIRETCDCGEVIESGKSCVLEAFQKQCSNSTDCGQKNACSFAHYRKLSHVGWLHLYNFFGLIWLLCFIEDFGEMVLAGSFAGWYWTFNRKKDLATFPVAASFSRTARYHLGTIAFGSLIISIIKFIRFFLEYLDYKLRQYNENPVAKAVMCCLRCCFWCLEKFMKFINRNAYIMCAVYGKNFCTSARDSFFLLMRNAVRAFVLDKVVDFLLFLGKVVIVGGVSILSFFIFSGKYGILEEQVPELHFYFVPVILIAVGTYFISSLFFSVYSMAVDTLFLCFLEDGERNDGSPEKPFYMPKELMEILGKKNKTESAK